MDAGSFKSQLNEIIIPINRTFWEILGAAFSAREYLSLDNMNDFDSKIHLIGSSQELNKINVLVSTPTNGNQYRGWWKWVILCI